MNRAKTDDVIITTDDLDRAVQTARAAYRVLRRAPGPERATWMEAVATALDENADDLIAVAIDETGLSAARLSGEVARTVGQLRMLARFSHDESHLLAVEHDEASDSSPPTPDLRRILVPIGPVAVFAASNFPFAFSVLGGDTASAWSAGCPVLLKVHEGHPRLSRAVARLARRVLTEAGAPEGMLALVEGRELGGELVQHPGIKAVAFTGSLRGGRALFDLTSRRPDPIPFYGELGSLNPVIVTPAAADQRSSEIAHGLVESFTASAGQMCTKPGLVFIPRDSAISRDAADAASKRAGQPLLTPSIREGFWSGWNRHSTTPHVKILVEAQDLDGDVTPGLLRTDIDVYLAEPSLREELFGPATVLVEYDDLAQLLPAIDELGGTLATAIHHEEEDDLDDLLDAVESISGRVVFQGWPTGVAVARIQHHGGPWPAATSHYTSVGADAIRRFQRPVVYQSAPESALPVALRTAATG